MKRITIEKDVLKNNNDIAKRNREFLKNNNIFTINLLGSPGAGKTSVLEKIIDNITLNYNMAVIEGDLYTTKDAMRIEKHNIDVLQVNTGGACHLDASMIQKSLNYINTQQLDFLVIENIGNLVCPASYDLSEDIKVLVTSVTEGNDKPLKYPSMFQRSSVVILNKIDMLELTDFDKEEFYKDIYSINRDIKVFEISCRSNEGIKELSDYFINRIKNKKSRQY
ncbi:hydrogenase nickel incorporation protein HypB [Romboutsia lituseburensis]|uniref:hydrogenase nickel incorporation protein HypB n=1 Tax=Romboutsia lituseburensis TaxID=1537 RepID=UPI0022EAC2A3|nr:hydrogenase nickel incorporation protein HypB [Romboutsia lituseburensis]